MPGLPKIYFGMKEAWPFLKGVIGVLCLGCATLAIFALTVIVAGDAAPGGPPAEATAHLEEVYSSMALAGFAIIVFGITGWRWGFPVIKRLIRAEAKVRG